MLYTSSKSTVYYFIATIIFYISLYHIKLKPDFHSLPIYQLDSLKNELDTYSCNLKKPNIKVYIIPVNENEYPLAQSIFNHIVSSTNTILQSSNSFVINLSTLNGHDSKSISCVQISIEYSSKKLLQESILPGLQGNYYIFIRQLDYIDNEKDINFLLEFFDNGIYVNLYNIYNDKNIMAEIIWNIIKTSYFQSYSTFSFNEKHISNKCPILPFHSRYDFNFILATDSNFNPSWDFYPQALSILRPTLDALSSISFININSQIVCSTEILNCSEKLEESFIINVNGECFNQKLDNLLSIGVLSKPTHFPPPEINFIGYINNFDVYFQNEENLNDTISLGDRWFLSTLAINTSDNFYNLSESEIKTIFGKWLVHLRMSLDLPLNPLEYSNTTNLNNSNDLYFRRIQNINFKVNASKFELWDIFYNFEYNSLAVKSLDNFVFSTILNLKHLAFIQKIHFRIQIPLHIKTGFLECLSLLKYSIAILNGNGLENLTEYKHITSQIKGINGDEYFHSQINTSLELARQAYEISKNLLSDNSIGLTNYAYPKSVFAFIMSGIFPFMSTQLMNIIKFIKKNLRR